MTIAVLIRGVIRHVPDDEECVWQPCWSRANVNPSESWWHPSLALRVTMNRAQDSPSNRYRDWPNFKEAFDRCLILPISTLIAGNVNDYPN